MKTGYGITRRSLASLSFGLAIAVSGMATAAAQSDRTVVTFAAASFAEAGRGDLLRAWVEKFNDAQSEVEIQPIAVPFSSFVSTIFTQMGGGSGPDLVRFDLPEFFAAIDAGRVLPIDDMIDDSQYDFTAPDQYMKVGGVRYGIPFEISNYALVYNEALLPDGKVPATFDEFVEIARQATGDGNFGFAYRATMAERGGFWYDLTNFVYGFGGRWSDENGEPTFNSPEVVAGVTAYKTVYDAEMTPRGADASTYRRMFWEGKVAMAIDNGGVASILASQGAELPISAAPSPFPTRAQGMILAPVTVNANTKVKDAVAEFLRWMLQPEPQRELQGILGAANVATVVERSAEELAEKPWLAVYDEQTANSVPALPQGLEVHSPEIQQIVIEQVLRVLQGGAEPQAAMDEVQRLVLSRVLNR